MIALPLPEPPLAGTRYGLRPWTPEDASALSAAWADPEIRLRLPVPDPADETAANPINGSNKEPIHDTPQWIGRLSTFVASQRL